MTPQDRQVGAQAAQGLDQLLAAHPRHPYVGDHQVDAGQALEFLERGHAVFGGFHLEAAALEVFAGRVEEVLLVVDDQQKGSALFVHLIPLFGQGRQLDAEQGAAAAGAAGDGQAALVQLEDALRDGEAEPSALAGRLGGEEGVEDHLAQLLGNARAAVLDLEHHHPGPSGRGSQRVERWTRIGSFWLSIASSALKARFTTTCWSRTESPRISGRLWPRLMVSSMLRFLKREAKSPWRRAPWR